MEKFLRDLFSVDFPWIYFGKSERYLGIIQEFKFKKLSPQIKISKKKKKKNSDVLRGFDFWNIKRDKKLFCQTLELPKLG